MSEDNLLLWEVGCEELPAWACDAIERQLPALVRNALVEARLDVANGDADATANQPVVYVGPRRFAVMVEALPLQRAQREESRGPALRAAFENGDPQGAPTKACIGFANSRGLATTELEVREENGKEFVYAVRELSVEPIEDVWPALAEKILGQLQFAKPMRWGSSPYRFVRPIRWMATLHGAHPLKYECWGVTSGRGSRGHRFLGDARELVIHEASSYEKQLAESFVIANQADRRKSIEQGLNEAVAGGAREWADPAGVLSEVVHLVEHPTVLTGRFADKYLELPERVLVTAMQSHQRYLPVKEAKGNLAPSFLTVMNADSASTEQILVGYERVLAGRLDDAVFSFDRDRARGLDDMATSESLGAVVFHAAAGSLADRRDRISAVAKNIAGQLSVDAAKVVDAARLAKADQVSTVVQEFAELEGYVGSLYAESAGYASEVCEAIDWQFAPRGADAPLPPSGVASVIALADKIELLTTMFAIGEQPTGSRDPHGLRRAAIGVMRIVLEHDLALDLRQAIDAAVEIVAKQGFGNADAQLADQVWQFILDRVEKQLSDGGIRADVVRAARAANLPHLQQINELAKAIDLEIRGADATFASVLEAQDRSRKLIAKAGGVSEGDVNPELFEADSERELHRMLENTAKPLADAVGERRFGEAVSLAAALSPVVEAFFARETGVMVMSEDEQVRMNRLRLLEQVVDVTTPLGDLSVLSV